MPITVQEKSPDQVAAEVAPLVAADPSLTVQQLADSIGTTADVVVVVLDEYQPQKRGRPVRLGPGAGGGWTTWT